MFCVFSFSKNFVNWFILHWMTNCEVWVTTETNFILNKNDYFKNISNLNHFHTFVRVLSSRKSSWKLPPDRRRLCWIWKAKRNIIRNNISQKNQRVGLFTKDSTKMDFGRHSILWQELQNTIHTVSFDCRLNSVQFSGNS